MDAADGKQSESTHIDKQIRQRPAKFVGQADQRRMNLGRIRWIAGLAQNVRIKRPNYSSQRCIKGVSRIEALLVSFPLKARAGHFSSESERWVTRSRWSERPAMSRGKCSTYWTSANSRLTRWWRWRHAAAWASKCPTAIAP